MTTPDPAYAVSDLEYNVVTSLANLLQGEAVLARYEQDAIDAGDDRCATIFHQMREDNRAHAAALRQELARHLQGSS
jgi:hypothetical protein